jgi:hypothetical protein
MAETVWSKGIGDMVPRTMMMMMMVMVLTEDSEAVAQAGSQKKRSEEC